MAADVTSEESLQVFDASDYQPRLLVIGGRGCPGIRSAIETIGEQADIVFAGDTQKAIEAIQQDAEFSLVAFAPSWPGELPLDLPAQLGEAGVLQESQLVTLAGSWSEGETRTGTPWPDMQRVYWYDFANWFAKEFTTANSPTETAERTILIASRDYDSFSAVADELGSEGHTTIWQPQQGRTPTYTGIDRGLWIGGYLSGLETDALACFCQQMRKQNAPVVTLLDFPRHDEVAIARDLGAKAVLAKPWLVEDLVRVVNGCNGKTTKSSVYTTKFAA